jgi:nucleoside-diphosphate-sugar epimerase
MNVFVAGGTGALGRQLVPHALDPAAARNLVRRSTRKGPRGHESRAITSDNDRSPCKWALALLPPVSLEDLRHEAAEVVVEPVRRIEHHPVFGLFVDDERQPFSV